ncbi:MAG: OmpA family protein [Alteraurantiacibacter sp.]
MRNGPWILALAAGAWATPALAQDDAAYLGVEGGVLFPANSDIDIGNRVEPFEVDHDTGWMAGATLGYDWGWLRTEVEGTYRDFGVNEIVVPAPGIPVDTLMPETGTFDYDGDVGIVSLMANALVDFGEADGAGFAVGAGVGRAWMDLETSASSTGPGHFDDSASAWAWQGMAQARLPLSDRLSASARYRYFSTLEADFMDTRGRENDVEFGIHSVSIGLELRLGGRTDGLMGPPLPPEPRAPEPNPPRNVAPPPPPPFVDPCNVGPYIVFFDWDEAEITAEARSVLDTTITAYRTCGEAQVMLAGHADRSGPTSYNQRLSERRAAAVRGYLTRGGIPAGTVVSEAFGETSPRVATANGVRESQNRRVELLFGPDSGM